MSGREPTHGAFPVPGDLVGQYTLGEPIGSGALATVFKARQDNGDWVALKVLHPGQIVSEDLKRFEREYQTLSSLEHPNIVKVYNAGVHLGYPWIALEYVPGPDLEGIAEGWRVQPPENRYEPLEKILRGIFRGLEYLHARGLVHRDIKPSNILVDPSGEPKITDFGMVKGDASTSHCTRLTLTGHLVGTVAYMAPELIAGEDVDARADLYSLGSVLYLLLTHRHPIEADSVAGYLARHLSAVPTAPHELDPTIPPALEALCLKLLRKDREERFQNAGSALHALDHAGQPDAEVLRGREVELSQWRGIVRRMRKGDSALVALEGSGGCGKSHFYKAVAHHAHTLGLCVVAIDPRPSTPGDTAGARAAVEHQLAAIASISADSPTIIILDHPRHLPPDLHLPLHQWMRARLVSADAAPVILTTSDHRPLPWWDNLASLCNVEHLALSPLKGLSVVAMLHARGLKGAAAKVLGRRLHTLYKGAPGLISRQTHALIDAGWLTRDGHRLRPGVSIARLRDDELPLAESTTSRIGHELSAMTATDRRLLTLLALLKRPATATTLARCVEDPAQAVDRLELLCRNGMLLLHQSPPERYDFVDERYGRVLRGDLSDSERKEGHLALARELQGRRRRTLGLEVARHFHKGGELGNAYVHYHLACQQASRAEHHVDVIVWSGLASGIAEEAESSLDVDTFNKAAGNLATLRGKALLSVGRNAEAKDSLQRALNCVQSPPERARAAAYLGEALARQQEVGLAREHLQAALQEMERGAPERTAALCRLTQIEMSRGAWDAVQRLFSGTLNDVRRSEISGMQSVQVLRTGASLMAATGQLAQARALLQQSEVALRPLGLRAVRQRTKVILRIAHQDLRAGHLQRAAERVEQALDIARDRVSASTLCYAYSLLADAHVQAGMRPAAREAVERVTLYLKSMEHPEWISRLMACRVWIHLGDRDTAYRLLTENSAPPVDHLYGHRQMWHALKARCVSTTDPARCRHEIQNALQQTDLPVVVATEIAIECVRALNTEGPHAGAPHALQRYLNRLPTTETRGLRLNAHLALFTHKGQLEPSCDLEQIVERIRRSLNGTTVAAFDQRSDIQRAMEAFAQKG